MGTGSYLYAVDFAQYGFLGNGIMGPGTFFVTLFCKIILELRHRIKHKRWFRRENSAWLTPKGKCYWINLIPLAGNFSMNSLYLIIMTFAWRFSVIGGMNQGIISTLLQFSSVFNIITFYCFFNERVTRWQIVGICLMIVSLACMTIKTQE